MFYDMSFTAFTSLLLLPLWFVVNVFLLYCNCVLKTTI